MEPETTKITYHYEVPKLISKERVNEIPINSMQIIDEYVPVYKEVGKVNKYVPKFNVEERILDVTKPRLQWNTKEVKVPAVKEVIRYVESDSLLEIITRYMPDDVSFEDLDKASPEMQGQLQNEDQSKNEKKPTDDVSNTNEKPDLIGFISSSDEPITIDVPVPFTVPKAVCIPIEVPVLKFVDSFVPIAVRRQVTPKLSFTTDVYGVKCTREKPVLVVEDKLVPVPVDISLQVIEKDINVNLINPSTFSKADMQALWMRAAADQLEVYKEEHGGKLPPEMRVDPSLKVQPDDNHWCSVLQAQDKKTQEENEEEIFDNVLPIDGNHPLITTWLQSQWMNCPTTEIHNMYSPEFFRLHGSALSSYFHPTPKSVKITQKQAEEFSPNPADELPHPWNSIQALNLSVKQHLDSVN